MGRFIIVMTSQVELTKGVSLCNNEQQRLRQAKIKMFQMANSDRARTFASNQIRLLKYRNSMQYLVGLR